MNKLDAPGRKPINEYSMTFLYGMAKLDKWSGIHFCECKPVRKLESDYKDAIEAIEKMIIDRDAFHDKNVKLEKELQKQRSINVLQKLTLELKEIINEK